MTRTHRTPRAQHRHKESPALADVVSPKLFKALCDPNRIALLARLAECRRPCAVTELSGCCSVDFSVVSRHLATLREAGVLTSTRRGKEIYYEVRALELARSLRAVADAIEGCCGCDPDTCGPVVNAIKPSSSTSHRTGLTTARHHAVTRRKERR